MNRHSNDLPQDIDTELRSDGSSNNEALKTAFCSRDYQMKASKRTARPVIPAVFVSPSSTETSKEVRKDMLEINPTFLSPGDRTSAGSLESLPEKETRGARMGRSLLKRQDAYLSDETHHLSPLICNAPKSLETFTDSKSTKQLLILKRNNSLNRQADPQMNEQPEQVKHEVDEDWEPSNEGIRISYSSASSDLAYNRHEPEETRERVQFRKLVPKIKRSRSSCLASAAETRVSFARNVDPTDTRKSWSPKQGDDMFSVHVQFIGQASTSSLCPETEVSPVAVSKTRTAGSESFSTLTEKDAKSPTKCSERRNKISRGNTIGKKSRSASLLSPVLQPLLQNQRSKSSDVTHSKAMSISREASFEQSEGSFVKRSFLSLLSPSRILSFFKQSTESLPSQSSCRKSRRKQIEHPEDHTIVTINVSGRRFRINDYFLSIYPETLLGNKGRYYYYDEEKEEYFFDRDPDSFRHIWNFYHTGELHCPQDECLDAFVDEMRYFGLPEAYMCSFCWSDVFSPNITQLTNERKERASDRERIEMQKRALGPDKTPRQRLWATFQDPSISFQAKALYILSAIVILVSVLANAIETIPCSADIRVCKEENEKEYFLIDSVCVGLFTLEYLVKLYACPSRLEFMRNFMSVIDLLAILPYYADLVLNTLAGQADLGIDVFVTLRVLRILRVFKLLRNSKRLQKLTNSFKSSASDLGMVMFIYVLTLILFSSVIYFAETHANSQIGSIPDGLWYAVVTTTTTGYGDIVPKTLLGKVVGSLCCCLGIIVIAFPVPVLQIKQ